MTDLYSCQTGTLPNLLFLQQGDGTALEAAAEAGVHYLERSRSALLLDLDNDGDQDLVVQTISDTLILENNGKGRFTLRERHRTPMGASLSAADYDNDGFLDIYVCCYTSPYERKPPLPYHDANNGNPNFLLRGQGKLHFQDVTAQVGLRNNTRFSFASSLGRL